MTSSETRLREQGVGSAKRLKSTREFEEHGRDVVLMRWRQGTCCLDGLWLRMSEKQCIWLEPELPESSLSTTAKLRREGVRDAVVAASVNHSVSQSFTNPSVLMRKYEEREKANYQELLSHCFLCCMMHQ